MVVPVVAARRTTGRADGLHGGGGAAGMGSGVGPQGHGQVAAFDTQWCARARHPLDPEQQPLSHLLWASGRVRRRRSEGDDGGAVDAEESEFCFLPFEITEARFFLLAWAGVAVPFLRGHGERVVGCSEGEAGRGRARARRMSDENGFGRRDIHFVLNIVEI
jgi:hypothetical protein